MRNVHHMQAGSDCGLGLPAVDGDGQAPADSLEPLEDLFRDLRATAAGLSGPELATVAPFPVIVWGTDEISPVLVCRSGPRGPARGHRERA